MPSQSRDTLHLLLLTHSQNDAEGLVSLLRNSGRATRAHMISSLDDFSAQIQEKNWEDVLLENLPQHIPIFEHLADRERENKSNSL